MTSGFSEQEPFGEDLKKHLGNLLTQAREEREISLFQVITELKLSREYLQALESGDWSALPGRFYARGFLSQYARYLHVDIKAELEALKTGDYQLTRPRTFPDPPIAPKRLWAIISGIAFLLLLLLFNIFSSRESGQADTVTGMNPVAGQDPIQIQHEVLAADMTEMGTKIPAPSSRNQENRGKRANVSHLYGFKADKLPIWLRIFDSHKKKIRTLFLKPGKTMHLRLEGAIYVSAGRSGALSISMDGDIIVPSGTLGRPGSAVRMFRVSKQTAPN